MDNPYPGEKQVAALHRASGISELSIKNWFINARRRYLPKKPREDNIDKVECGGVGDCLAVWRCTRP